LQALKVCVSLTTVKEILRYVDPATLDPYCLCCMGANNLPQMVSSELRKQLMGHESDSKVYVSAVLCDSQLLTCHLTEQISILSCTHKSTQENEDLSTVKVCSVQLTLSFSSHP
jgi:hypothetical protein